MSQEERPWGRYEVLEESASHKVKRITVLPGKRLSYQRHKYRAEHWFIVSGVAEATVEGSVTKVGPGSSVDIEVAAAHRISNVGSEPVIFVEVQTGTYLGEDDIERLEDDFGRA
jgi:mannose-6-phosphate isomerase